MLSQLVINTPVSNKLTHTHPPSPTQSLFFSSSFLTADKIDRWDSANKYIAARSNPPGALAKHVQMGPDQHTIVEKVKFCNNMLKLSWGSSVLILMFLCPIELLQIYGYIRL